ncbi:MAG: hypothetical protein PWP37_959 [Thermotogota bacterium]|nr:hypothetical protein [Thermotogota bacterium]MDK2864767.1 hypothetical protein [Thermotogota bacterium]HCZ07473.1 MFS transporter [Thermotogota bacterium]
MVGLTREDYRWNFIVNSLDFALFSLGMTLGSIFTLFPVFAKNLGASNFELGLISAVANLGWGIPAIWGARSAERSPKKLTLVLKFTLGERLPYLFMALIAFYLAVPTPRLALYLSIAMVGVATFTMGFLGPPWMSMIEKVIDPVKRGSFFAVGNGLGAILGVGGSVIARKILSVYSFPENFGYVFLISFFFFMLSFVFLSLTREVPDRVVHDKEPISNYFRNIKNVFADKYFRNFIIERVLNSFMFASSGFITVFLLKKFALSDDTAAVFTAIVLVAQGLSSFIFGPMGDRMGHKLNLILSKIFYTSAVFLAVFGVNVFQTYLVFVFMGFVNTTNNVGSMAITLDFVTRKRKELYMGSLYFVTAPFSFIAPLVGGKIADLTGYASLMVLTGIIGLAGSLYLVKFVKDPRVRKNSDV